MFSLVLGLYFCTNSLSTTLSRLSNLHLSFFIRCVLYRAFNLSLLLIWEKLLPFTLQRVLLIQLSIVQNFSFLQTITVRSGSQISFFRGLIHSLRYFGVKSCAYHSLLGQTGFVSFFKFSICLFFCQLYFRRLKILLWR
jgi:hypothetical protein